MSLDFGLMEHHYFHNLHYEKFPDGTVKCIEDEIPFELPEGWEWTRLQAICEPITDGTHKTPTYSDEGFIFLSSKNVTSGHIDWDNIMYIPESLHNELYARLAPQKNDILLAKNGTTGVAAIVDRDCIFDIYVSLALLRIIGYIISPEYLLSTIASSTIQNYFNSSLKGIGVPNLHLEHIRTTLIPVAPINEQYRIATKLEQLLSFADNIESDKTDLQTTIQLTKSKILDLAIRGKLVPQNPDDEPASVLLERIRAEKEELIKQGKIKRDKKGSVIFKGDDNSYYEKIGDTVTCIDEELPFDIPDNWAWIRLSSACIINPKNSIADDTIVSFVPMTLIQDGYANEFTFEQRKWGEVKKGFTHFAENDVGFAKITPCFENRKSVVFRGLCNGYGAGTTELHILRAYPDTILPEYFLYLVKTESFISGGKQTFSGAVGQQRVGKEYVYNYFCPVPPLSEQQRIIKKCSDIMTMLNSIEKSLS